MNDLTYKPLSKKTDSTKSAQDVYIPKETAAKKQLSNVMVSPMPLNADKAIKSGIPIVGYKGLTDQYSDNLNILHPDFCTFLKQKKVHTVHLLYNSDLMHPDFKPGTETDLAKKFYNIYYAVKKFKEALVTFDYNINLIFSHIQHHYYLDDIVTIDDLIAKHDNCVESITKWKLKKSPFLHKINLTEKSLSVLYNDLKLRNVNEFYNYHSELLHYHSFTYNSISYEYNGDKVETIKHNDLKLYMRVGPDYYKRVMVLNSHDEFEEVLMPWKKPEIILDYGAMFVKSIPKYDSFINKPANDGEYKRTYVINHNGVMSELYNIYHPVTHQPEAGEWPTIKKFLTHIFSACNIDGEIMFDWGLDYIQLTYQMPRQRLPIIALVSNERNTGKSTFLDFMKMIFGANMSILDNQRFSPQFTSHFAGKLLVAIDEGHIPVNDKLTKEMIKNMATGKVMWLEGKGSNAKSVDNFTHLMFCSNDENNFMQIDPGENRFAVLKVPSYRKAGHKDDPDLLDKMRKEIPAFLNFLLNRKLHYPNKTTRFWFPDRVYTTEALQVVMDHTKSTLEKEIQEWMVDSFINFRQLELNYTLSEIHDELNRFSDYAFSKTKIRDFLLDRYNIKPGPSIRYYFYSINMIKIDSEQIEPEKHKGRCCTFYAKDFLGQADYEEIFNNSENCVPKVPKVPTTNNSLNSNKIEVEQFN